MQSAFDVLSPHHTTRGGSLSPCVAIPFFVGFRLVRDNSLVIDGTGIGDFPVARNLLVQAEVVRRSVDIVSALSHPVGMVMTRGNCELNNFTPHVSERWVFEWGEDGDKSEERC